MTVFTLTREVPAAVEQTWARLTDFAGHGAAFPVTTMTIDPGEPGVGWEFTGRTGVGPMRITDHMMITLWAPPSPEDRRGVFRAVKIGPWLRGWAQVEVEESGSGSQVTWTEELGPRIDPIPRLSGPISARVGRALYARTLSTLTG